ncbi:hypothetical protein [Nocardioides sp. S5]|uniref:hypothetical protein n=1 Tax=Nocardioides sp. S5 TaxID=2017486 RepID=UPI001A8EDE96|nr:hypothetical protein [Nocardioides sp. S5]
MPRPFIALAALVAVGTLTGCASDNEPTNASETQAAEPETFTVVGAIKVVDRDGIDLNFMDDLNVGDECTTNPGYGDIAAGAQVTVLDSKGEAVGVGSIGDGELTVDGFEMLGGGSANGVTEGCKFPFKVEDIPEGGNIYSISVGMRPDYQFTRDEALSLTLVLG